jgi:hypothetical protein
LSEARGICHTIIDLCLCVKHECERAARPQINMRSQLNLHRTCLQHVGWRCNWREAPRLNTLKEFLAGCSSSRSPRSLFLEKVV